MKGISRRIFLRSAASAALVTAAKPALSQAAPPASPSSAAYTFLNKAEAGFLEAAVARLIPSDDSGPGAIEAGVPSFIDKQLGGAWGAGERLYRSGPWREGTPSQGYQLPYTPAQLFRNAIRAINDDVTKTKGTPFAKLSVADQDSYLDALHKGKQDLGGVPANVFFDSLLAMTLEGFFSDPAYGGNKDMVSWRMIGFPGAYANYYHLVDQHGIAFNRPPTSLAENARGDVHVHADISTLPGKRGK